MLSRLCVLMGLASALADGSARFVQEVDEAFRANRTLRDYFMPGANMAKSLERNWLPFSSECAFSENCHCAHVSGESPDKSDNPTPGAS